MFEISKTASFKVIMFRPAAVDVRPLNSLNATGIFIRLIFTSREREWRIYTPAL